jgi:hypothetical protein
MMFQLMTFSLRGGAKLLNHQLLDSQFRHSLRSLLMKWQTQFELILDWAVAAQS